MKEKNKVAILVDTSCDVPEGFLKENEIDVIPMGCIIGDEIFTDSREISSQELLNKVRDKGVMPKTSAPSVVEFEEYFAKLLENADEVLSLSISSGASCTYNNSLTASEKFNGKVVCIDTKSLSGGFGLLLIKAVKLRDSGYDANHIKAEILTLLDKVNLSFVVDTMEFLHKGGRCTSMQYYGAKILKIHPEIVMVDGKLKSNSKYFGNINKCYIKYADDLKKKYPDYDNSICLVTHSPMEDKNVQVVIDKVKEMFDFKEIYDVNASSTITCHCGENTLGILFIYK
ncbi:MAG TPA: hypothetical protein DDW16_03730 [Clostridiales bacterium]|nr:hypothetical protein [Clostridiales bacterium]